MIEQSYGVGDGGTRSWYLLLRIYLDAMSRLVASGNLLKVPPV